MLKKMEEHIIKTVVTFYVYVDNKSIQISRQNRYELETTRVKTVIGYGWIPKYRKSHNSSTRLLHGPKITALLKTTL